MPALAELPKPDLDALLGLKAPEFPPSVPALAELPKLDLDALLGFPFPGRSLPPATPRPELIKPDDSSWRSASLELTLAAFEPAFVDQFRGARLRSEERGPDWLTQAAASYRKLFLNVLHRAAPNELVLPWVRDPRIQLDQHGNPTRRTKIDWLCKSIQHKGYRRFVRIELDSGLEVLELLNQSVHVNDFPELEESFELAATLMEFAILQIARLSGHQRSN